MCVYRLVERKREEGKAKRGMERSWQRDAMEMCGDTMARTAFLDTTHREL